MDKYSCMDELMGTSQKFGVFIGDVLLKVHFFPIVGLEKEKLNLSLSLGYLPINQGNKYIRTSKVEK